MTDREETATEAGTKHRECQTCRYREEGTVSATGGGSSGGNRGGGNQDGNSGSDGSGGSDGGNNGGAGDNPDSVVRISVADGGKESGGKDNEPDTGDASPIEFCATFSMIAGFTWLLLYFADRRHSMYDGGDQEGAGFPSCGMGKTRWKDQKVPCACGDFRPADVLSQHREEALRGVERDLWGIREARQ